MKTAERSNEQRQQCGRSGCAMATFGHVTRGEALTAGVPIASRKPWNDSRPRPYRTPAAASTITRALPSIAVSLVGRAAGIWASHAEKSAHNSKLPSCCADKRRHVACPCRLEGPPRSTSSPFHGPPEASRSTEIAVSADHRQACAGQLGRHRSSATAGACSTALHGQQERQQPARQALPVVAASANGG